VPGAGPVSWEPVVRTSYMPGDVLPADAERQAMVAGVQWYVNAILLPNERRVELLSQGITDVPPGMNSSMGQLGVLEGFSSDTNLDGSQPQATNFRDDCASETSASFAVRAAVTGSAADRRVAVNLLNFAWLHSGMRRTWNPPTPTDHFFDTFGLLAWESADDAFEQFYKDDDARALLGGLATSGLLNTDRWVPQVDRQRRNNDEARGRTGIFSFFFFFTSQACRATAGDCSAWQSPHHRNYRVWAPAGNRQPSFRSSAYFNFVLFSLEAFFADVHNNGWRSYYNADYSGDTSNYSPHFQVSIPFLVPPALSIVLMPCTRGRATSGQSICGPSSKADSSPFTTVPPAP
jgi:hypothetical protein